MMSMSWPAWIWPARTSPGPVAVSVIRFGPSPCMRSASCLMFSTMSVTSSRTPGMLLNSCSTPSICTAVTAAPCSDDSRMRRIALPSVMPKPRSSGSATMVATRDGSAPGSTSSFSGLISDCQLRWMTALCLMYPTFRTAASAGSPSKRPNGIGTLPPAPSRRGGLRLTRAGACAAGSRCAGSVSCRGSRRSRTRPPGAPAARSRAPSRGR